MVFIYKLNSVTKSHILSKNFWKEVWTKQVDGWGSQNVGVWSTDSTVNYTFKFMTFFTDNIKRKVGGKSYI